MATAVKLRLNIYPSLRRHPWRVLVGLLVLAAAAGAGAYFLVFYRHFRAAERAIARYDFDEAQEHLAACIRAEEGVATYIPFWPRRADLYLLAARTARRAERFPEAAAHLGEYERLQGKTSEQLLEHSMLRVQQGDLKENGIYLVKLLREDPPQTTLILEALAQGTYHVYLLSAAKRYAEKVLEREPDNVLMLLLLGIMLDGWHNVSEAEQYFRAAVNAQPGHAQARLELAQFLLRQRRYAEAAGHLEQLRERHYRPAAVLMGLALCCRQEGQTPKERELLDTLLAESPESADALAERGRLELEAGELEAAERDLRDAVARAPYDREAIFYLAQCLHQRGKDDESAFYSSKMAQYEADMKRLTALIGEIDKKPNDVELHREAGVICLRNGLVAQAERWLLGALQIDPRHKPTYQSLADLYTHVGRLELAAQYREGAR